MWIWIALALLALWWWIRYQRIPENFPKGPYGLPLVGYWPIFLAETLPIGLEELHKRFGPNLGLML